MVMPRTLWKPTLSRLSVIFRQPLALALWYGKSTGITLTMKRFPMVVATGARAVKAKNREVGGCGRLWWTCLADEDIEREALEERSRILKAQSARIHPVASTPKVRHLSDWACSQWIPFYAFFMLPARGDEEGRRFGIKWTPDDPQRCLSLRA